MVAAIIIILATIAGFWTYTAVIIPNLVLHIFVSILVTVVVAVLLFFAAEFWNSDD